MKRLSLIVLLILYGILSCAPPESEPKQLNIAEKTDLIFDELVKVRRDLYQNPELSGNEVRTSKVIANYLSDLGLDVITDVAGHGVIGILKGEKKGKNIAWRVDMDAIAGSFAGNLPYSSQVKGVYHGCGHDVHMAIGLGIAKVLAHNRSSLKGTFFFIFQPEEETFVGAKNIVASEEFSKLSIEEIYALHVTAFPVGSIVAKPFEPFAYQKRIQIRFDDQVNKADLHQFYKQLRSQLVRKQKNGTAPWQIIKAFSPKVGLTNPNTSFSDYFFLDQNANIRKSNKQWHISFNAYETNKSNLPMILPSIEAAISESKLKKNFISSKFIQENPTVMNDEKLTKQAVEFLKSINKQSADYGYGHIPYFNDDFIYFQQKIPGAYFLLGCSNEEKGIVAMNHSPSFQVDEECIRVGVKNFASLILERASSDY